MSYVVSAHFFFLSVIVAIIVGLISNLFITSYFRYQDLTSENNKEDLISSTNLLYKTSLAILVVIIVLYLIPATISFILLILDPNAFPNSYNIPINQINNYYNISSVNVTYNYPNNPDIVDILNFNNPKF